MKKNILALLLIAFAFTTCKKSAPTKKEAAPTILLSKIYNESNRLFASFTYNGKQLTKYTKYHLNYTNPNILPDEHEFIYDTQGKLSRVNITTRDYLGREEKSYALITYEGNNIKQVTFKNQDNTTKDNYIYVYQGDKVIKCGVTNYEYDNKGNSNKLISYACCPAPTPPTPYMATTHLAFDNNNNLANAVPYPLFFSLLGYSVDYGFFAWTIGPNNSLTQDVHYYNLPNSTVGSVFNYEYNSDGYPSKVTGIRDIIITYYYEYIKL